MLIFTDKWTRGMANTISQPRLLTVQVYMTESVLDVPTVMTAGAGSVARFESKSHLSLARQKNPQ